MNFWTHIPLDTEIPEALIPRDTSFSWIVGSAMAACLLFLAMARARKPNVYAAVAMGMMKTQGLRVFLREAMPLRGSASLLLLLNYWIASGLLVYLLCGYFELSFVNTWIVAVITPLALLFFHLFSMSFSAWVIGAAEVFRIPVAMKLLGAQVLGVIYFICALVWILQPDAADITLQFIFWLFIAESSFRILKSVSVVLRQGVTWYYIILYFCTLEILPFLVMYHYVTQNLGA